MTRPPLDPKPSLTKSGMLLSDPGEPSYLGCISDMTAVQIVSAVSPVRSETSARRLCHNLFKPLLAPLPVRHHQSLKFKELPSVVRDQQVT